MNGTRRTRGQATLLMRAGLVTGTLLVVLWVAVFVLNASNHEVAVRAANRQNENIAAALEEHTLRVLAAMDQATLRVANNARTSRRTAGMDLERFANETGLAPSILLQLATTDASGRMTDSNLDPNVRKNGPVDLSDREHIRVHLGASHPELAKLVTSSGLFIGKPVLGKVSGRWSIQLTRKLEDADGRPLGVVVASLDPTYFETIFGKVSMGEQGGIGLLGRDLMYRARIVGGQPAGMGATLAPGSVTWNADDEGMGSYMVRSQIDPVDRFFSYHNVRGYPLRIMVFESTSEALVEWKRSKDIVIALAALMSLGILLTAALVVATVRRIESSNETLRESEQRARSASQAKSEFLSAMSHELRTPLTSIQGFAHLMERRAPDPLQREQAMMIRKAAEHLAELLNGILDLAKIEAGAMRLAPEECRIAPLINDEVELFALTAQDKGLTLVAKIGPEVPDIVLVDPLRLKQILNNLLSNAVKFTERGGITLEVSRSARGGLVIAVEDTGSGIAPDMLEAVFERFRQGDSRVSYRHGGTGLGLSLSRSLARTMGGDVVLAHSGQAGSRFELILPESGALPQETEPQPA